MIFVFLFGLSLSSLRQPPYYLLVEIKRTSVIRVLVFREVDVAKFLGYLRPCFIESRLVVDVGSIGLVDGCR